MLMRGKQLKRSNSGGRVICTIYSDLTGSIKEGRHIHLGGNAGDYNDEMDHHRSWLESRAPIIWTWTIQTTDYPKRVIEVRFSKKHVFLHFIKTQHHCKLVTRVPCVGMSSSACIARSSTVDCRQKCSSLATRPFHLNITLQTNVFIASDKIVCVTHFWKAIAHCRRTR